MNEITVRAFSDYHVHLRQGEMTAKVAPWTAAVCGRALVMPNLTPPVADAEELYCYRSLLRQLMPGVDLLMTFKLLPRTRLSTVAGLAYEGAVAGKLYPAGVTTHSADGIPSSWLRNPSTADPLADMLTAMQDSGLVLCLHGEAPWQENPLRAEPDFLPFVSWVLGTFPRLRVVLEHISTQEAVGFVLADRSGRLAATITAHHLACHVGHLVGRVHSDELNFCDGKLHPHLFCAPVLKQPADRLSLRAAVLSGDERFFLGSDSAPHPRTAKESDCGCAGVWSAPVLAPLLAWMFDSWGCLGRLTDFTSTFGDRFYGRDPVDRTIRLVREPWRVPDEIDGIVPFLAGRILQWRLEG